MAKSIKSSQDKTKRTQSNNYKAYSRAAGRAASRSRIKTQNEYDKGEGVLGKMTRQQGAAKDAKSRQATTADNARNTGPNTRVSPKKPKAPSFDPTPKGVKRLR